MSLILPQAHMTPLGYDLPVDTNRKRPYEEYDASQPNASKRLVGGSFLRLCVNTKSTGFIIGKGGSGIEEIKVPFSCFYYAQTTSHIEITVDNSFEPFKGVNEYFVTLVGSINGIIDALKTIICRLPKQFDHVPEGEVCKQIVIPWGNAGKLIGKGGETIRRMNEDTHTNARSLPCCYV